MHRPLAALAVATLVLSSTGAHAVLPQRTFVSVGGNDANTASNCGVAAPCRSFGSAMSVTTAGGEIIVVDSGGYGRVTVDRSIAIISPPGVYAGVTVGGGTNGVDIATGDVVLRGLTINGIGGSVGVSFTAGNSLTIEDCIISNMGSTGIDAGAAGALVRIKNTTIRNTAGLGVNVHNGVTKVTLDHVLIEHGSSTAILISEGAKAVIADSRIERNNSGIYVLPTGTLASLLLINSIVGYNTGDGLYAFASGAGVHANVSVSGGAIVGNGNGVRADSSSGATVWVAISDASITDSNGDGVEAQSGAGTRVSVGGSTITRNAGFGLLNTSATLLTRQNNTVHDNNGGGAQTSGALTPLGGI